MSRVVERLFRTVPRGCLQFVIVVFPDHTHLLFLGYLGTSGLSTTLVRHLLIELARIQTYTELWVESDFDI